jgi:F-type H+-transporting ATPase subunit gamma
VSTYKKAVEYIEYDEDKPYTRIYDYVTIGKHAREFILRTGQNLIADFSDEIHEPLTNAENRRFVRFLLEEWKTGKYAKITIIYNHYISAIAYQAVSRTFLPIVPEDIITFLEKVNHTPRHLTQAHEHAIEPDLQTLIDVTIPLVLDAQFHEVLLEARASEYSARMIAMKNASDSANKKV